MACLLNISVPLYLIRILTSPKTEIFFQCSKFVVVDIVKLSFCSLISVEE